MNVVGNVSLLFAIEVRIVATILNTWYQIPSTEVNILNSSSIVSHWVYTHLESSPSTSYQNL